MKEDVIRRLIRMVEESNIGELEYSRWGSKIKITKNSLNSHLVSNTGSSHVYAVHPQAAQSVVAEPAQAEAPPAEPAAGNPTAAPPVSNAVEIKSPMVGTYYRSPSPESDPYVAKDANVKKGQVLCIIEAMKLMNEIESDIDGRIVEILVDNAQPVEYNQPLFLIEPA